MTARSAPAVAAPLTSVMLVVGVLATGACGGSPSSPSQQPASPSMQYVSVTGSFSVGAVGATTQLRALANTTSGRQDVTGQATWRSSNDAVATVSSSGLVSARGTGLALITATYQGFSGYGGISVATTVNVMGTWTGSSTNPTSSVSIEITQAGDSVSAMSTASAGGQTYRCSWSGSLDGGTSIVHGTCVGPSGLYSSWTDERCALESANSMRCVNPTTLAQGGGFALTELTLGR